MPPFKDEHVLIISPGSLTTSAQLGLPESFTPPKYRFPTRMFPGTNPGEWEPVRIRTKVVAVQKSVEPVPSAPAEPPAAPASDPPPVSNGEEPKVEQTNGTELEDHKAEQPKNEEHKVEPSTEEAPPKVEQVDGGTVATQDVEMLEAPPAPVDEASKTEVEQTSAPTDEDLPQSDPMVIEEDTTETFEDDYWSTEGAVYPIQNGRIENWSCFFALLSHIYNMISPPFHMPVLFVSQPCWSARDHEMITQYVFEHWKIPAFCLMDAALTACYAYGVSTALVLDVGHGKCDVTAVTEFQVNDIGRGVAITGCGGRDMTLRLSEVLESQGFTEDMAEQLKKSPICEVLPLGIAYPQGAPNGTAPLNPAAAASTGALDSGLNAKDMDGLRPGQAPRGPGTGTVVGEEATNGEDEDDGVLDVVAIVARDNAAELLAKREREKAEKAAAKKVGAAEGPRPIRLRNSERERAAFTYVDYVPTEELGPGEEPMSRKRKREVEVGAERFMAATPGKGIGSGIIDRIAEALHHTVLSVPDVPQRSTLWDNLIVVGNGSRIRGFTSSLISILSSRYVLSPSTATIFTSELPSNFTTPVATPGTNTPIPGQGSHAMHHPAGHGVNPLLVAATKNMMQPNVGQHLPLPGGASTPGQFPLPQLTASGVSDPSLLHPSHTHRGFSQSPTAIKTVKPPDYFPEWKAPGVSGMEEASFLGAQVAAKVVFIVDQGNSKGFLTRSEYNELGPTGIHDCAM